MKEKWRSVVGYEGIYEVSNTGRVRRIAPDKNNNNRYVGRILVNKTDSGGYAKVLLHKGDGSRINKNVHKLVAESFIGPCQDGMQVHHKDSNRYNPCLDNLEYVTRSQNTKYAVDNGNLIMKRGSDHASSKLTDKDVLEIKKRLQTGEFQKDIAKDFGVTQGTISNIVRGITKYQ